MRRDDTAPMVVEYTTPPLYSDEARRAGSKAPWSSVLTIDAAGRVNAPRVTGALGAGLDQNAVVAVRQWRFRPGTRNGVAVPMDVEIPIAFTRATTRSTRRSPTTWCRWSGRGDAPAGGESGAAARPATGAAGTVVLDVVLLENGTPRIVRILRSLGPTPTTWRCAPSNSGGSVRR
jgi:TonB family protein